MHLAYGYKKARSKTSSYINKRRPVVIKRYDRFAKT